MVKGFSPYSKTLGCFLCSKTLKILIIKILTGHSLDSGNPTRICREVSGLVTSQGLSLKQTLINHKHIAEVATVEVD